MTTPWEEPFRRPVHSMAERFKFSRAARSAGHDAVPAGKLSLPALRALAAASILIPLIFLCLGAWQSYRQHMRDAEAGIRRGAEIVSEQVLRVLEVQELVIGRVDDRISGMSWNEISGSDDLHRWLLQLDESLPTLDVIWLIDPEGKGRNSSRYFPAPSTSRVADRDYFTALNEKDTGTFIGEPRPGRSTAGLFFNIARRRTAPDGAFDGLIVTSLDPAYFAEALKGLTQSSDDSFSVIREDGTGLARGPQPLQQPMRLSPESGFLRAIRGERKRRTALSLNSTGSSASTGPRSCPDTRSMFRSAGPTEPCSRHGIET